MAMEDTDIRLNGLLIGTSTVDAHLRAKPVTQTQHRSTSHRPPNQRESRSWAGKNMPRLRLRIFLEGPARDVEAEADFVADQLDRSDFKEHFTIETGQPFWRNIDRAAVWVEDISEKYDSNGIDGVYEFSVVALIEDRWPSDGGDYEHKQLWWFKKKSDTEWERDDGKVLSDPLIRLPDQRDGYPKAVRQSNLSVVSFDEWDIHTHKEKDQEALDRGVTRHEAIYDMSDFMHPKKSSLSSTGAGEVGRVPVWICPSEAWLNGDPAVDEFKVTSMDDFEFQGVSDVQPINEKRETEADSIRVTEGGSERIVDETVPFRTDD